MAARTRLVPFRWWPCLLVALLAAACAADTTVAIEVVTPTPGEEPAETPTEAPESAAELFATGPLEFDAVRKLFARWLISPLARARVEHLRPFRDPDRMSRALDQVAEMGDVVARLCLVDR